MVDILFKEESYKIIGACFEVHKALGMVLKKLFIKMLWNMNLIKLPFLLKEKSLMPYIIKNKSLSIIS